MKSNASLPHGPDFRLVHQVSCTLNPLAATGQYFYDGNEVWLAMDHFPGNPIMPAVRQIRSMLTAALSSVTINQEEIGQCGLDMLHLLKGLRDVQFFGKIKPNSNLTVTSTVKKSTDHETTIVCELKKSDKKMAAGILTLAGVTPQLVSPVTINCQYFGTDIWEAGGGFMPPEMILESMAQTAIQIIQVVPELQHCLFLYHGIEDASFHKPVPPNTLINLNARVTWHQENRLGQARCTATVDNELVAEQILNFAVTKNRQRS